MPIISVRDMKITDEREKQTNKTKTENNKGGQKLSIASLAVFSSHPFTIVKGWELNHFIEAIFSSHPFTIVKGWELNDCCAFKLGFLKLICKASLNFKSNLKLALSIILKQRELYESKHVVVEHRCLKIWDLLSYLICFSILVLK